MRILVLGGGSSQLNLLRRAREDGHYVVLADHDTAAPGRAVAHNFAHVSTFDTEGVTRAAREFAVDAIATAGSDQPVLSAAIASHRLGLPFALSPEVALAVTNKRVMKEIMTEAGIPSAPYAFLSSGADEQTVGFALEGIPAPWVIKPLDSQGQRGVMKLETPQEIVAAIPEVLRFSRLNEVVVEQYYESMEITVSGWVTEGRLEVFSVTDRVTVEYPPSLGVCVAHRFPSVVSHSLCTESPYPFAFKEKSAKSSAFRADFPVNSITGKKKPERLYTSFRTLRRICELIVKAFEIPAGPLYVQLLCGSQGLIVNEVACRLGGAYEDIVLPVALGVDPVGLLLGGLNGDALLAGSAPALHAAKSAPPATGAPRPFCVPLLFCRPGTVAGFRGRREALAIPGVFAMEFLLPVGVEIRDIRNSTQRIGYAVIVGETPGAVNASVAALFETIAVVDDTGANLLINTSSHCMLAANA